MPKTSFALGAARCTALYQLVLFWIKQLRAITGSLGTDLNLNNNKCYENNTQKSPLLFCVLLAPPLCFRTSYPF